MFKPRKYMYSRSIDNFKTYKSHNLINAFSCYNAFKLSMQLSFAYLFAADVQTISHSHKSPGNFVKQCHNLMYVVIINVYYYYCI